MHVSHLNKRFTGFLPFWVILIFLCCNFSSDAQLRVRFDNYTISNGLSQSSVNAILQDRQGFIWIATQDGLNKYDGYTFEVFKNDNKDPKSISHNFITTMCEDDNGNIWLGTEGGGLNKFTVNKETFTRFNLGENFRNITYLAKDNDGNIWVASEKGGIYIVNEKTGKAKAFEKMRELETNYVQSLYFDNKGRVWIGTGDNGLWIYTIKSKQLFSFSSQHGGLNLIGNDIIWTITGDKKGNIWTATNNGLFRISQPEKLFNVQYYYRKPGVHNGISSNSVKYVFCDKYDQVFIGTADKGLSKLVRSVGKEIFYHYESNEYVPGTLTDNNVQCIFEDRTGCIWVGTANGLSKYDPVKQFFDHITMEYNNPNSLDDKQVWAIHEDNRKVLWIGTRNGLSRIENNIFRHYPHKGRNRTSPNNNSVLCVYVDKENRIWAGAVDGLFEVRLSPDLSSAKYISVPYKRNFDPAGDNRIYQIQEDQFGNLWVASKMGVSLINKKTGVFKFYNNVPNDPTSLSSDIVRALFIDSKNKVWVATDDGNFSQALTEEKKGVISVAGFKRFSPFQNSQRNDEAMITSFWEEKDGTMWMGTYGAGLLHYEPQTNRYTFYTEKDGLSNNSIYSVLGDGEGNLWMSTNKGLSQFNIKTEKFQNYKEQDGLQSDEFNIGAYFRNREGRMYFGGINGLNAFFPKDIRQNTVPPIVAITDIHLYNKHVAPGYGSPLKEHVSSVRDIYFNYRQNNISIFYAALHFSNSENNRYKYMLEGVDDTLNNVGTTRSAHYTNLTSGTYTFKVYACNSDGIWSTTPAILNIHISPPFWATWWFRTLVIIFLLALTAGIWQARIYTIKMQRIRLATEVRERTKEVMQKNQKIEEQKNLLQKEKEKVEQLLLNILPEDTAEELKNRGKASARSYRQVTVMFTDFKGFTQIAETMRPAELVARLDSYFIRFDEIIQKYGLEKIKTIGDSYMCAGGLPIRNKSNPIDTVLAALEIQSVMNEIEDENTEPGYERWDLRVGINTGEVIAGVIGIKRFAYDIWGNTVNTASRMETSCEPGRVNISGSTFQYIEPFFECTYRGKIPAKNKGEIDMYYVNRIKPELSADEKGLVPNEKFRKYVDLYLFSSINYKKAERHIMKILKERLPDNLYYHGIHHTYDVVEAVERIALMEGITGEEMFVLKSAATYHDAGFVEQYAKNEPIGIRMAQEILPIYGYTEEQVKEVEKLIFATIIPHDPQSHLQEIICDADLDYLGRDDFHEIADTLRRELRERGIINSDRGWDELQIKFLTMHKYFTKSAIALRQAKKEKHIREIEERLRQNNYAD